jgi:hypothetical protein
MDPQPTVPILLEAAQSRAATGGVYKGQGRNQRELDDPHLLGIPRSRDT